MLRGTGTDTGTYNPRPLSNQVASEHENKSQCLGNSESKTQYTEDGVIQGFHLSSVFTSTRHLTTSSKKAYADDPTLRASGETIETKGTLNLDLET